MKTCLYLLTVSLSLRHWGTSYIERRTKHIRISRLVVFRYILKLLYCFMFWSLFVCLFFALVKPRKILCSSVFTVIDLNCTKSLFLKSLSHHTILSLITQSPSSLTKNPWSGGNLWAITTHQSALSHCWKRAMCWLRKAQHNSHLQHQTDI